MTISESSILQLDQDITYKKQGITLPKRDINIKVSKNTDTLHDEKSGFKPLIALAEGDSDSSDSEQIVSIRNKQPNT